MGKGELRAREKNEPKTKEILLKQQQFWLKAPTSTLTELSACADFTHASPRKPGSQFLKVNQVDLFFT